jgi:hypothetical protein
MKGTILVPWGTVGAMWLLVQSIIARKARRTAKQLLGHGEASAKNDGVTKMGRLLGRMTEGAAFMTSRRKQTIDNISHFPHSVLAPGLFNGQKSVAVNSRQSRGFRTSPVERVIEVAMGDLLV